MATIWGSGYNKAFLNVTSDGGAISCAVKIGTSPPEVYFKYSEDGSTWPADGSAHAVGTLGTTNLVIHCHQLSAKNSPRMFVTNGVDKMWKSDNYGRTWSAF